MHHIARRLLLTLPLLLIIAGCDSADIGDPGTQAEGLTGEQAAIVDEMPDRSFELQDLVLPNGSTASDFLDQWGYGAERPAGAGFLRELAGRSEAPGPQAQKNLFIALMTREGLRLTHRPSHVYEELPPLDGVARPAQEGIGFVYGSKDYSERSLPPEVDGQGNPFSPPSCRDHLIHGVDGSGFMSYLAGAAGFTVNAQTFNVAQQSDPEVWTDLFATEGFDKLRLEQVEASSAEELEPGDFVYWVNDEGNATHIAFVGMNADGEIVIFQAHGSRYDQCERNFGPERGPRQVDGGSAWFDGSLGAWHVNRIVTDISGEWRLYGRCEGQSVDAFDFDFAIETTDQETSQSVEGGGPGTDYNGEPMQVQLEGTYTPSNNNLHALLHFTWDNLNPETHYRIDQFEVRLDFDDTGYFLTERVEQEPGAGCPAEVRLVNLETAAPPPARPAATDLQPERGTFMP